MTKKEGKRISRKIYYYDTVMYELNNISGKLETIADPRKMIKSLFERLDDLYNKKNIRELQMERSDGNRLFFIVDEIQDDKVKFRAVLSRVDLLPYIETEGALERLSDYIEEDQNLAEITHCIYFLDNNILGVESNFAGAKINAITEYIYKKSKFDHVKGIIKLNKDQYARLIESKGFSLFNFAVKRNSRAYDNVLSKKSAFRAAWRDYPDADIIEIKAVRKSKKDRDGGMRIPFTIDEMRLLSDEYREDLDRFQVSQGRIVKDCVDLLSDKLVGNTEFYDLEDRSIVSETIYNNICEHYNFVCLNSQPIQIEALMT